MTYSANGQKVMPVIAIDRAGEAEGESLYEVRKKIYPRAVSGWFARLRVELHKQLPEAYNSVHCKLKCSQCWKYLESLLNWW